MKTKSYKVSELTHTVIDEATGELLSQNTTYVQRLRTEPDFIKLYTADILKLMELPKSITGVLGIVLKHIDYDNKLYLNIALKKLIAKETKLSLHTVNGAFTKLVKSEILLHLDTGLYLANPLIFGKGKWKNINKLRITTEFSKKGRNVKFEVLKELDAELKQK